MKPFYCGSLFLVFVAVTFLPVHTEALKCYETLNETITTVVECNSKLNQTHCVSSYVRGKLLLAKNSILKKPNQHSKSKFLVGNETLEGKGCGPANFCDNFNLTQRQTKIEISYNCTTCNHRDLCNAGRTYVLNGLLAVVSVLAAFLVTNTFRGTSF